MAREDGGNAFPALGKVSQFDDDRGTYLEVYQPIGGMSLRDYFAAKAMHAELVTAGALKGPRDAFIAGMNEHNHTAEQHVAFNAYRIADAMIAERLK